MTGKPTPAFRSRRRGAHASVAVLIAIAATAAPTRAQQPAGPTASVSGVVFDSIARKPIAGATVELVSGDNPTAKPFTATSGATGSYTVGGVPFGRYLASFFHESLDTLGLEAATRQVDVRVSSQRVDLATPSVPTIIANICPAGGASDSSGVLIGHVRATETRAPLGGATVIAEWGETVIDARGVREQNVYLGAVAEEPGWFAICGLPSDATLQVQATAGVDSSGFVEMQVPSNGLRYATFLVGGARRIVLPPEDTTVLRRGPPETALRGGARLSGTVMDYAGRPVANAHALIWGTRLETTTNAAGGFSLDSLPGGTHTLEIRVIGFLPVTSTVQLAASRPATTTVTLAKAAEILPTVTVRGEIVYSRHLADFNRRRRVGFGQFRTAEEIARRGKNAKLSQLLQEFNNLRVDSRGGQSVVTMQRNATQSGTIAGLRTVCVPTLYVDGLIDRAGDFDFYYSDEIAGLEVYREHDRPSEFVDPANACGAVVVWTRPPPPKPKKPGPPVPVVRPPGGLR